jgi:hypothetical protein
VGIRGGTVHGASDRQAAFIKDSPVHIRDICATIYHLLGIDRAMSSTTAPAALSPSPTAAGLSKAFLAKHGKPTYHS